MPPHHLHLLTDLNIAGRRYAMNEDLLLIKKLESLRAQHRDLDQQIKQETMDEFTRQRLKKIKLEMREQISKLEKIVYPDITA